MSHSRCCAIVAQKRQRAPKPIAKPGSGESQPCIARRLSTIGIHQPGCGAQFPPLNRIGTPACRLLRAASLKRNRAGSEMHARKITRNSYPAVTPSCGIRAWARELRSIAPEPGKRSPTHAGVSHGGQSGSNAAAVSSSPAGGPADATGCQPELECGPRSPISAGGRHRSSASTDIASRCSGPLLHLAPCSR